MDAITQIENFLSRHLPIDRAWFPEDAYLVGGSVRDVLLSRVKTQFDLDFVVAEGAIELARDISRHYRAGFVILDDLRHIARVVFAGGTIDLAQREGDRIESDLNRRDYTINAIAYNLCERRFYDPHNGLADLGNKTLRAISRANLADDPLRLLRGYRQAAQLDFSIDPDTQNIIRSLAPLLDRVAAERVNMELSYLLESDRGSHWLTLAVEAGLFALYFPDLDGAKLAYLPEIDKEIAILTTFLPTEPAKITCWRSMARLATLVDRSPAVAETQLTALKYSRQEIRTIVTAVQYLPELCRGIQEGKDLFSLRKQYFFFLAVNDVLPILVVLGVVFGGDRRAIELLLQRYFDPRDPVAHPRSIVTGTDLLRELNLKPSPTIGKMLEEIQIAYIEGKISNFGEAIDFARGLDCVEK